MNNRCQLQRGFFTLRSCGQTAIQICSSCARSVCSDHLSPQAELPRCVECAARDGQDDSSSNVENTSSYDNDWTYTHRSRYHSTYGSPTYHDSDYDSFSATGEDEAEAEADDPEADFSDS